MMILDFEIFPPYLCKMHLVIIIDGLVYDFGRTSLIPGGLAYIVVGESDERTPTGPWSIDEWPPEFPEDRKIEALELINREIPWGCCGGCTPL